MRRCRRDGSFRSCPAVTTRANARARGRGQVQGRAERAAQYVPRVLGQRRQLGGHARRAPSAPRPRRCSPAARGPPRPTARATPTAAAQRRGGRQRVRRRARGSAASSATRRAPGESAPPGASRPFATASLTITRAPAAAASARAGPAEGSRTFQVLWNEVNSGSPSTVTSSARRTASRLPRARTSRSPPGRPRSRSPASAPVQRRVVQHAACPASPSARGRPRPGRRAARTSRAHCARKAASEWSLTSCTSASIRQSPT